MAEKEYIERGALLQFLKNEIKQCEDDYGDDFEEDDYYTQAVDSRMTAMRCVKHRVETSPAADVVPVVHGEWDEIPNVYMSVASKNGSHSSNATSCSA